MPAQPRKRTTKPVKPAEAAAAEAVGDGDITVPFRGQEFVITGETQRSFQFAMAIASGHGAEMMHAMIAPADRPRFIRLGRPNEPFLAVSEEFFTAYREASGQGNS